MNLLIKNALFLQNGVFNKGDILCKNGKIVSLDAKNNTEQVQIINAQFNYVLPGFVDLHVHGAMGFDCNDAKAESYDSISKFLATQGVSTWLATVLSDTEEKTLECLKTVAKLSKSEMQGAQLLGTHLEGPFLSQQYKGAMPENLLKNGNINLLQKYITASQSTVKYMTISPEVDNAIELIKHFSDKICFSLGHSGSDYETSMRAFENGARSVTHTFNAMRLFHQHEPAIMGAALESDCWCEAICDGKHLHYGAIRMLLKCKGWDKIICVSDSIMAAGLSDGKYTLGVNDIFVKDGDAKLLGTDVRAGSTTTAIKALKNLMQFTKCTLAQAVPLFTQNPCDALRLKTKGRIQIGYDADFTILTPDYDVQHTIVSARSIYTKQ